MWRYHGFTLYILYIRKVEEEYWCTQATVHSNKTYPN